MGRSIMVKNTGSFRARPHQIIIPLSHEVGKNLFTKVFKSHSV